MSDTTSPSDPVSGKAPSGHDWQRTPLASFPPPDQWDDWMEYDAKAWPRKIERRYQLVPTICFNCEAGCGLVAYIDKSNGKIKRVEGNPYHPGSRGRNCAKGPATINQVNDPGRILYPMKRVGKRGEGDFERTTWDEVLETLAARIRKAFEEDRRNEVMYHVGRPGEDGFMGRVLHAWGIDGHNSHTNVCSAAARLGYALWTGSDRPSPDYANAKLTLLISSHLETGHYFNPHAQRIIEGKMAGAKIVTIDVRLSNTASMSDHWIAPHPGTEAALMLGFAHVLIEEGLVHEDFIRRWMNWRTYLTERHPGRDVTFPEFMEALHEEYARYTPEWVAKECGVDADMVRNIGRMVGEARGGLSSHVWRSAASGNEGGWQVARTLQFLCVLTGSVNSRGGTSMHSANKFVPKAFGSPPPQNLWNELLYPIEWPLSHHELSFLLPHLVAEGRGRMDTYFTRVYNPVWINPDGFSWMEMLRDEEKVGLHAALTPTWNETALFADYVLPMGLSPERHDIMSQETHAGRWIGFRQPVLRVARERNGEKFDWTYEANPGEVWEEDEFWIALSWKIDPDGALGIRKHFESPYRPGERVTIEEYYRWIFENSVPGLPEAAKRVGMTPLEYMRRHGAFEIANDVYETHEAEVNVDDATLDGERGMWMKDGKPVAIDVEGVARAGFHTPSKRLEFLSPTMETWGFGDNALPGYIRSHVHPSNIDRTKSEFVLVPTFRVPTLIHSRSANAKWLYELSNANPVWINTGDAAQLGVETGDLVRVSTRIGYFVNRAWVTEGMRPDVVACSHHLGRWRLTLGSEQGVDRWAAWPANVQEKGDGIWRVERTGDIEPWKSDDPDSQRVWWKDGGVHQNLTFPVQPDPISGMHCWHQKVTVTKAHEGDNYGDVEVDTKKSKAIYAEWLAKAAPRRGPGGERRPLHFARAVRPTDEAYYT